MSATIVVVGSLNMDLVMRLARAPAGGETLPGHDFATLPGGKGANQAVACARMGARVAMVGRVGADANGAVLRQRWQSTASMSAKSTRSRGAHRRGDDLGRRGWSESHRLGVRRQRLLDAPVSSARRR